jgi:ribonuclease P protein component
MDSRFRKEERLKSNLAIQALLKKGRSLSSFPLKIFWIITEDPSQEFPVRVAVSVPRKKFRSAVDRNLLKRRIRESYRQNKHSLYDFLMQSDLKISMVILFLGDEFIPYDRLDSVVKSLFSKLIKNINP